MQSCRCIDKSRRCSWVRATCAAPLCSAAVLTAVVMAEREMLKQQQDAASLARLEAVRLELAALKSQLEAAVGVQEGVPPQ